MNLYFMVCLCCVVLSLAAYYNVCCVKEGFGCVWFVCIYCGFVSVDFHVLLLGCGVVVCIMGLIASCSRMYVVGVGFFRVVCKVVRAFWSTRCVSCVLVG